MFLDSLLQKFVPPTSTYLSGLIGCYDQDQEKPINKIHLTEIPIEADEKLEDLLELFPR